MRAHGGRSCQHLSHTTGTEGLIGTTFVHDDDQVGTVVDVVERWTFTLEVELDGWKMGNGSGAKLYLPVRYTTSTHFLIMSASNAFCRRFCLQVHETLT